MVTEKVSVSLDAELLAEARERIRGNGSLSAYLNDALYYKLLNERQRENFPSLDERLASVDGDTAWWSACRANERATWSPGRLPQRS